VKNGIERQHGVVHQPQWVVVMGLASMEDPLRNAEKTE